MSGDVEVMPALCVLMGSAVGWVDAVVKPTQASRTRGLHCSMVAPCPAHGLGRRPTSARMPNNPMWYGRSS